MKQVFSRISYANVTATLALIAALGGVAWAAETAKKNTVVSKSIKNEEVKSKDLGEQAVGDEEVTDLAQVAEDVPLTNGWAYDDILVISKSNDGVVRLDGNIDGDAASGGDAFTLSPAFRPADDAILLAGCQGGETAVLSFNSANGVVNVSASPTCDNLITLTGISFTGQPTPTR
jgi:hypothetical protein